MTRYSPIAAVLAFVAVLIPTLLPTGSRTTYAQDIIMAPDGGRLEALDAQGNVRGPCALKYTDVDVAISGRFTRVTLTQKFANPYPDKIEAVYTFPLSHRAAVDRMTMTVGDRVVVGEVKERQLARQIYEAARAEGYVASLLEQERPNIFTQSVANIEPGAQIDVQISYVELLDSKDGLFSFEFPMVVGPRYVPGAPKVSLGDMPAAFQRRDGVILMAPATFSTSAEGDTSVHGKLEANQLAALIGRAQPIQIPAGIAGNHALWYRFEAAYPNGSKEVGEVYNDGTGHLNGRWFWVSPATIKGMATGFSPNTDQVPDASRITPMPVRPEQRAGHDVGITVTIDTGGPGIVDLKSELHEVIRTKATPRDDGTPRLVRLELKKEREIPNRDFVLTWRQTADTINEAVFTHTGKQGSFVTLILAPPARVADAQAVPRELVFVLDTSGSMSGFPVEKAKSVMSKAIAALRPQDTFNLITFSGDTHILWDRPRPGSKENIELAQKFLQSRSGSGGTEMMKAIEAALAQRPAKGAKWITAEELANLPADGRSVDVLVKAGQLRRSRPDDGNREWALIRLTDDSKLAVWSEKVDVPEGQDLIVAGKWATAKGRRVLNVTGTAPAGDNARPPIRICCFMTDGYVGNDMAIIDAVARHAGTTRVFSFGIGNSVNRYLLDGMARAGRGEVEYVLLESDGDAAVQRFSQRIQTPVLTDVEVSFSSGLKVTGLTPRKLPDLFDVKPLILHGQYTAPGSGTVTIRGRTAAGLFERTLPLELPANQPAHDTIATLWARARVEELMNQDLAAVQAGNFPDELRKEVTGLGEKFSIMTQFTSFVAVEKQRVTLGGQPRLVAIPIEMPDRVSYEGVFGPAPAPMIELISLGTRRSNTRLDASARGEGERQLARLEDLSDVAGKPDFYDADGDKWSETSSDGNLVVEGLASVAEARSKQSLEESEYRGLDAGWSYGDFNGVALSYGYQGQPAPGQSATMGGAAGGFGGGGFGIAGPAPAGGVPVTRYYARTPAPSTPALMAGADGLRRGRDTALSKRLSAGKPAEGGGRGARIAEHGRKIALNPKPNTATPAAGPIVHPTGPAATRPAEAAGVVTEPIVVPVTPLGLDSEERPATSPTTRPAIQPVTQLLVTGMASIKDPKELEVARKKLIPQHVAVRIGELTAADQLEDARALAEALARFDPEFRIGVGMHEAFADAKLTDAERKARIATLAKEATKAFEPAFREAKLRQRLDARLLPTAQLGPAAATRPAPADVPAENGRLRVTVRSADVEAATLDAFRKAGLNIEATAKPTRLVVGTIAPERLADLTLTDAVRRIVPTEMAE